MFIVTNRAEKVPNILNIFHMKCIILQENSSAKSRSRVLSKAFFHLPLISSTGSILKYPSIYFSILSGLGERQLALIGGT